ncbi:sulfurtransferase [Rhodobacter lacus]|uniref:Sulfurtransferase n=1 Tax=Rhodobacter lacus TaxID=1641972 RepID=A0ABW5A838_9RHOB
MIVTAAALKALLSSGDYIPVDTRAEEDYRAASLPGAVNLDVYSYFIPESSEEGVARMAAGAQEAFARLGLDGARKPVFFEQKTGMVAPRGLWFHELAGFEGGMILDGGIEAWLIAGGETAPGTGAPEAITHGAAPAAQFRRDLVATTEDVLHHTERGTEIFDVRRPTEYDGSFVHACCARPGRIPGAHFAFYEDMLSEGYYRSAEEIAEIARNAGLAPEDSIITYCHRGARAATALYGLRRAGFDKVRIYTGSWHEWAGRADLPIEIG